MDLESLLFRAGINFAAMAILLFGIYYPRYKDKETVTAAALFNVFVFAVLLVLSSVEFSVAAGFGLFAILALFTLRSETISKTQISYFFGSISFAVINAIMTEASSFVILISSMVLIGAYFFDHPSLLRSVSTIRLTLDFIPENMLSDEKKMLEELSTRLGVIILSYKIISTDYISEMVSLDVHYRKIR